MTGGSGAGVEDRAGLLAGDPPDGTGDFLAASAPRRVFGADSDALDTSPACSLTTPQPSVGPRGSPGAGFQATATSVAGLPNTAQVTARV